MPTQTVSFSLDAQTKKEIDALAKRSRKSRSDIVREMFARYSLEKTIEDMERTAAPVLEKLGLVTEDDIAGYAKH